MIKDMKLFCVRNFLFACIAGLLGQIFLPSVLYSSTGVSSSPTGAGLVKEQIAHKVSFAPSTKPMTVYVIQQGDVFCDILLKTGVSRKDTLYISKKASLVYKLTKMRPGSELEFYFSQGGTGLQEIDYTPSSRKKVILYNGKVISLVQARPNTLSTGAPQRNLKISGGIAPAITVSPSATAKNNRQAVNTSPKKQAGERPDKPLKNSQVSANASKPQTQPAVSVIPINSMKTFSSYNCGLPDNVRSTTQTPYELLAKGLVLSTELPTWDKDSLTATIQGKPTDTENQDISSTKFHAPGKKKGPMAHRIARSGKARQGRIAKANEATFLKVPLTYRRVSSGFSYSRIDPFTNLAQPHLGIDYSAPSGTPVHSIGPGIVNFIGWDGGYGKTIRIMHANGYISQYGHLSHFTRNIMIGKRVRKGETIGYVGMTGHATGPHLDFRITHRGTYINPENIECGSQKFPSKKSAGKQRRVSRG
jgi:murein DD-endopeptidase MepM/ murein hydrolase activator NlpD